MKNTFGMQHAWMVGSVYFDTDQLQFIDCSFQRCARRACVSDCLFSTEPHASHLVPDSDQEGGVPGRLQSTLSHAADSNRRGTRRHALISHVPTAADVAGSATIPARRVEGGGRRGGGCGGDPHPRPPSTLACHNPHPRSRRRRSTRGVSATTDNRRPRLLKVGSGAWNARTPPFPHLKATQGPLDPPPPHAPLAQAFPNGGAAHARCGGRTGHAPTRNPECPLFACVKRQAGRGARCEPLTIPPRRCSSTLASPQTRRRYPPARGAAAGGGPGEPTRHHLAVIRAAPPPAATTEGADPAPATLRASVGGAHCPGTAAAAASTVAHAGRAEGGWEGGWEKAPPQPYHPPTDARRSRRSAPAQTTCHATHTVDGSLSHLLVPPPLPIVRRTSPFPTSSLHHPPLLLVLCRNVCRDRPFSPH